MNTYVFCQNNGNATIILSADCDEDAEDYLKEIVQFSDDFYLDSVEEEEE